MTSSDNSPQLDVDGNPVPVDSGAQLDSNGNVIPVVEEDTNAVSQQLADARAELMALPLGDPRREDKLARLRQAEQSLDNFVDTQGEWLQAQATFMDMSGMPSPRYLAYSHPELKAMVERRNDPGQVGELGSSWHDLGARFVEFDAMLWKALLASQQHWTGAAADQARAFSADVGTWFASAGRHAQLAGNRLAGQADVATWARDTMPDPVESDPMTALRSAGAQTDPLAFPAAMGAIEPQERASREAHQQAAAIVEQYDRKMAEYGATMPAFAAPPAAPDSAGPSSTGMPPVGDASPPSGPGVLPTGPRGNPYSPAGPQPSTPTPDPSTPVVDPVAPSQQTTAQQWMHEFSGSPGPAVPGAGPAAGAGSTSGGPGGGVGGGLGSISATPHPPSNAGLRTGPPGAARIAGQPSPVGGTRAAGRGGGPMTGMPLGARRAEDDDDDEHKSADYIIEPDPDSLFGVPEKTVRPVIGES